MDVVRERGSLWRGVHQGTVLVLSPLRRDTKRPLVRTWVGAAAKCLMFNATRLEIAPLRQNREQDQSPVVRTRWKIKHSCCYLGSGGGL
jgi:hypothetical protein